jgi:hypothetical protein
MGRDWSGHRRRVCRMSLLPTHLAAGRLRNPSPEFVFDNDRQDPRDHDNKARERRSSRRESYANLRTIGRIASRTRTASFLVGSDRTVARYAGRSLEDLLLHSLTAQSAQRAQSVSSTRNCVRAICARGRRLVLIRRRVVRRVNPSVREMIHKSEEHACTARDGHPRRTRLNRSVDRAGPPAGGTCR